MIYYKIIHQSTFCGFVFNIAFIPHHNVELSLKCTNKYEKQMQMWMNSVM